MPDPISHLCIGYVFSFHFFRKYRTVFLLATIAPDIDGLIGLIYIYFNRSSIQTYERGIEIFNQFHPSLPTSLFFLPVFPIVLYFLFRIIKKSSVPKNFLHAYILFFSAVLLHICLDLLMTGNKPFWPFPLEAGLEIIPYTVYGSIFTPVIALLILTLNQLVFQYKQKKMQ